MGSREKSCTRHKVIWGACRPPELQMCRWTWWQKETNWRGEWLCTGSLPTTTFPFFSIKKNIYPAWHELALGSILLYHEWKKNLDAQSCLTHCNPVDYSPPGSSVQRILQARPLEWIAIPFSRGSYWPRDQTQVSCITGRFFTVWVIREAQFHI